MMAEEVLRRYGVRVVVSDLCPRNRVFFMPPQVPTRWSSADEAYAWAHGVSTLSLHPATAALAG